MDSPQQFRTKNQRAIRDSWTAMQISVAFGILMLAGKSAAYVLTGSAAILSDAAESVVHLFAVLFAAFSLWLSSKPANRKFTFGYERIGFFSAGFEGALIILAAVGILWTSIHKLIVGIELENVGIGTVIVAVAGIINGGLGWYLIKVGRRTGSLILEANGKHVLTDCWTSLGVVVGLLLVILTGWRPFDPIFAIAMALNIVWSGGRLVTRSVGGLLDYSDPETGNFLRENLDRICSDLGIRYHGVRFRHTGFKLKVELHLLFPAETPLVEAHESATRLEELLPLALGRETDVLTHLEALEDHAEVHQFEHYMGRPGASKKGK